MSPVTPPGGSGRLSLQSLRMGAAPSLDRAVPDRRVRARWAGSPTRSSASRKTRRSRSRSWSSRPTGRARPRARSSSRSPTRSSASCRKLPTRLGAQLQQARRVARVRRVQRLAAAEGDRRRCVPGAQEDRRHPQHAAAGHPGSVLQRRVRRHLHEHLRDHRRRLRLSRARRNSATGSARSCCACRASRRSTSSPSRTRRSSSSCRTASSQRSASSRRRSSQTLAAQNAVAASGVFDTADRPHLRAHRRARSTRVEAIRDFSIRANNRIFRLGDIADVRRGYVDPPQQKMRWQGQRGARARHHDGEGRRRDRARQRPRARASARIVEGLPVGVEIAAGREHAAGGAALGQRVRALARSRRSLIVLVVSLVSLGLRTGLVVAVSIPLVLATTFLVHVGRRHRAAQDLARRADPVAGPARRRRDHRGRDDGRSRWSRGSTASARRASRTRSTAFPMLTGTLVTVAGFLPIATAQSATGEYTRSIFQVSAIALIASWFVAVIVIPYLGYRMLPDFTKDRGAVARLRGSGRACGGKPAPEARHPHADPDEVYDTPFYRRFRRVVDWCVAHRWIVHRRHARRVRRRARGCSGSCRSSSSRRRRVPS